VAPAKAAEKAGPIGVFITGQEGAIHFLCMEYAALTGRADYGILQTIGRAYGAGKRVRTRQPAFLPAPQGAEYL